MPAIHVPTTRLKNTRQRITFRFEGEDVIMRIGNVDVAWHYEDALQLSQWLRVTAKMAKDNAGDKSRHWSAVGILENVG